MTQKGPTFQVEASCESCVYCKSRSETVEDGNDCDTSHYQTCNYVGRYIGADWQTPDWCPYIQEVRERVDRWAKCREELRLRMSVHLVEEE